MGKAGRMLGGSRTPDQQQVMTGLRSQLSCSLGGERPPTGQNAGEVRMAEALAGSGHLALLAAAEMRPFRLRLPSGNKQLWLAFLL